MTPEEALEHCLEEIEAGQKTITECAAQHPDLPELEAQLKTAQALRAWQTLTARPEAGRRIEARLRQQAQSQRVAPRAQRPIPALRWAVALILAALLLVSAGAVAASANSLPGGTLYSVKRTTESVQLFFTPPSGRAAFHTTLAQRRLDELSALVERESVDAGVLTDLTTALTTETQAALAAVKDAPPEQQAEVLEIIIRETGKQQTILQTVKESAPPEAQGEVLRALEASGESQAFAAERIEEINSQAQATASPTPASHGAVNSPTRGGHTQAPPPPATQAADTPTPIAAGSTLDILPSPTQSPASTRTPVPAALTDTPIPPPSPTQIPPGQARKTATATNLPTSTQSAAGGSPGNGHGQDGSSGGPNCTASNPNLPNYCTPTAALSTTTDAPPLTPNAAPTATPTPCPTNASGKPKCKP
jgi:hypothetical protein